MTAAMNIACETMTRVEPVTVDTMPDSSPTADLVIVANRLPVRRMDDGGGSAWTLSSGGLVTALVPVLRENSGVWIGWPGDSSDSDVPGSYEGIELRAVRISEQEYDEFYLGFANATSVAAVPRRHPSGDVRTIVVARLPSGERTLCVGGGRCCGAEGASVWIHDYQLQLVPRMLRELRPDVRIGFFLHIPFPPRELFMQLPWRREILEGLLGADLVGLQVSGGGVELRPPRASGSGSHRERRARSSSTGGQSTFVRSRSRSTPTTSLPGRTTLRFRRERGRFVQSSATQR